MAIRFSIPDTEIIVTTGTTEATCQEIHDAARVFEGQFVMMGMDWIVDASGKAAIDVGAGIYTEIILTLRNPWTIRFEDEASAHCTVKGGTLLAVDAVGDPRPVSTNYGLTISQSVSGTLIEAGGSYPTPAEIATAVDTELTTEHGSGDWITGTAPTASEVATAVDTELTSQHGAGSWTTATVPSASQVADAVWDEAMSGHTTPGSAGELMARIELIKKILVNRLVLSDGTTGNHILYDDDDVTPLLTWDVSDKDGLAIEIPSGSPAKRSKGA